VVVRPEGLRVGLNDEVTGITGWDPDGDEVDEPAFVAALLDELGATVCTDPARVYATGISAGGYLALVAACALPDRIAAVAVVGGAYQGTACASEQPLAFLAFHGVDDIVTPFEGRTSDRVGFVPVLDVLGAQAARNGCTGGPEARDVTTTVTWSRWTGCERPTELYQLDDHGHAWPGHPLPFRAEVLETVLAGGNGQPADPLTIAIGETPASMARNVLLTNVELDATERMWEFFTAQPQ
jgi:poly(3-hydroxybutyrate) depolymerase